MSATGRSAGDVALSYTVSAMPTSTPRERYRRARLLAMKANVIGTTLSFDDRREALYGWWMPTTARNVWLNKADRDAALWLVVTFGRHLLPEQPPKPIDLDTWLDWLVAEIDRRHEEAWRQIGRAIAPMLAARCPVDEIKRVIDRLARETGFADLDWGPLVRAEVDRHNALRRWRRRHNGAS